MDARAHINRRRLQREEEDTWPLARLDRQSIAIQRRDGHDLRHQLQLVNNQFGPIPSGHLRRRIIEEYVEDHGGSFRPLAATFEATDEGHAPPPMPTQPREHSTPREDQAISSEALRDAASNLKKLHQMMQDLKADLRAQEVERREILHRAEQARRRACQEATRVRERERQMLQRHQQRERPPDRPRIGPPPSVRPGHSNQRRPPQPPRSRPRPSQPERHPMSEDEPSIYDEIEELLSTMDSPARVPHAGQQETRLDDLKPEEIDLSQE